MKKFLLTLLAVMMISITASAQNKDAFLDRYETFVETVVESDLNEIGNAAVERYKQKYNALSKEVEKYRKQMSNDDLQRYYKLKARYQKKMATYSAKRQGSKVKGYVKGLFN